MHLCGVLVMPGSSRLIWDHSVHFAKFPILHFLKLCPSPIFHQIHPNFIQGILIMGNIGYYFYWGLEGAGHYSFNRFIRFQPNFIQSIIIRANIGYYFFGDLQNFYCTLKFLSAQDHIGLEISKRYSSYRFHLMSTKLYEDIAYHKGMQAITLLGNRPSFTKFKTL